MNKKELVIKSFFTMTNKTFCFTVYRYHKRMQKAHGAAVSGHLVKGTQSIRITAKDFNMSVGRASQLITLARTRLEERSEIRPDITVGNLNWEL